MATSGPFDDVPPPLGTPCPENGPLAGYAAEDLTLLGATRTVYRTGSGPAVIVIHEIPGLTPLVAEFGRRVAERGMTAVLPDLFGTPGREPTSGYIASSMARACVNREFTVLATGRTSPITQWLRALATHEHGRVGGPGVGAVGMCLTGGFALAMMVDPVVVAPVLSQPSLPLGVTGRHRRDLGISPADLTVVKRRVDDGACVIGLRFSGDRLSPPERFGRLREELGDGFIGVEIDSSVGNPWGYRKAAHSVLTEDYSDAAGSPTREALEQVLEFFADRLAVAQAWDGE
jgi:dienelactone hydrolase